MGVMNVIALFLNGRRTTGEGNQDVGLEAQTRLLR